MKEKRCEIEYIMLPDSLKSSFPRVRQYLDRILRHSVTERIRRNWTGVRMLPYEICSNDKQLKIEQKSSTSCSRKHPGKEARDTSHRWTY